ncbi:hypothetical protein [Flavihumibacter fluvii]|uniref:hypothetical protein n=1 Tax=Flavihumibacter fluvii TaxID=2838157 RepID=UPI001BDE043B|nr:hypothetical protein [Flavihumibacter fluvii]ULQ53623.1 hypothetical protein KJS93_04720 [Flavihumibacter fluvii]
MPAKSQSGKSLAGEYYLEHVMETASGFLIRPDSSFEFFFSQGALDRTGKGRWQVKDGKLLLQSQPWPGLDFKLNRSNHSAHENILIQVVENNRNLLPFVDVMLVKGELVRDASLNQEGLATFPPMAPDTILLQFRFCPERYSAFPVNDSSLNHFEFSFQPWVFDVFFNNFELEVTPTGLKGNHPLLMGKVFEYKRQKIN